MLCAALGAAFLVPAVAEAKPGCQTRACHERVIEKREAANARWCARHPACVERVAGRVFTAPYMARLQRIAYCETGGTMNPRIVSRSGRYRGLLQFDYATWRSVGGRGDPAAASPAEQYYRGALLYRARGPAPWPVCGYR